MHTLWYMGGIYFSSRRRNQPGFTIVELLIVIVVIGILAAISVVAYNGVQTRANNTSRHNEFLNWVEQYELYRAYNNTYPNMPDGGYCLGTGFVDTSVPSDGIGDCRDIYNAPTRYSTNTTLNSLLATVGTLPSGIRKDVNNSIGPYVEYTSTTITLLEVLSGYAGECPPNTFQAWQDGAGRLWCGTTLTK